MHVKQCRAREPRLTVEVSRGSRRACSFDECRPYAKGFDMTSRCRARLAVAAFAGSTAIVAAVVAALPVAALAAGAASADAPAKAAYDYPTQGRVEYVLGCMDDNGHDFANVYK